MKPSLGHLQALLIGSYFYIEKIFLSDYFFKNNSFWEWCHRQYAAVSFHGSVWEKVCLFPFYSVWLCKLLLLKTRLMSATSYRMHSLWWELDMCLQIAPCPQFLVQLYNTVKSFLCNFSLKIVMCYVETEWEHTTLRDILTSSPNLLRTSWQCYYNEVATFGLYLSSTHNKAHMTSKTSKRKFMMTQLGVQKEKKIMHYF